MKSDLPDDAQPDGQLANDAIERLANFSEGGIGGSEVWCNFKDSLCEALRNCQTDCDCASVTGRSSIFSGCWIP